MNLKKSLFKLRRRLLCKLHGGSKILVLGDSHSGVFEYGFDHGLTGANWVNCEIVGGATASGLGNRDSSTGARKKFESAFRRFSQAEVVVLMLGEVDCSVTFWLLSEKYGRPPEAFIDKALANVAALVHWMRAESPGKSIMLVAAPLPSVRDDQVSEQDLPLRRQITASQYQRTSLVRRYNEALQQLAEQENLMWLDTTSDMQDPATMMLAPQYCRTDVVDYHHAFDHAAPVWSRHLCQLVAPLRG